MAEPVKINVRAPYDLDGINPLPMAFLYIGSRIHDVYVCGLSRKRVRWLPRWLPFNVVWDTSEPAQIEFLRRLRGFGTKLANA